MSSNITGNRVTTGGLATAIFDSAHALVVTFDVEGRITGFNRACELLTGYDASEIIGTHVWDGLLPAADIPAYKRFFAELRKGGDISEEHESIWIARDGRRPVIAWNNSCIRNAVGEVDLVVGVGVDVTERKTAADRMARTQRIAGIGSWESSVESDEEYWSEQFYVNLGLVPYSVPPSTQEFYKHVHPDDRGRLREMTLDTLRTGSPYSANFRVIRPDGSERLIHEEAEIILDDDGKVVGLSGSMQDVTELHETENRLKRLTQSFTNAQRIAGIGNWDWDAVTKNEWWSDEIYRIMGLQPGSVEAGYDSFLEHSHPEDRKKIGDAIKVAQDSLTSYDIIFRIVRPDGEIRVVRETGECVVDGNGSLAGLTGTVQDITEQHAAELSLANTARRLQAAVGLARLGTWEWDPDSNMLENSDQTRRICGLGPEHAVVDNEFLMAMIPEDEHAVVLEKMNRAVSLGDPYTNEYHIVRPDGDSRTVFEHGEAYYDERTGKTKLVGTIQDITEQKRTEEALRESEARLRGLFDHAPVGIGLSDARGHLIQVNEAFATFLGYAPNEMLGLTYRDVTHPDHQDASERQMKQLLSGEARTVTTEKIYVRKDGTGIWGSRTQSLVRNENGHPEFHVVIVEDIDDRKRAEAELAKANFRLEEAQRIANLGHWEWLPESDKSVWSDQTYRIFGMEPGETQSGHDAFFNTVHEDDRDSIANLMSRTLETGEPYETEFRIFQVDGTVRHIFERAERYIDEETGELSIRGVMQDITDRKAVEEELRETADKLEKSQSVAKIGSWVWEIDEDKEWWSDEIYRMFGMEVGAVVLDGYGFLDYVHPDDRDRVRAAQDCSVNENVPYEVEYRIRRTDDGREVIISEYGEMEYDVDGRPLTMRGTAQDVTERKKAEQELRETKERLEEAQRLGQMGSWTWDPEEDVEWWSDQQYRIFGLEPGSVVLDGWDFLKYVHPDDRGQAEKVERQAAKTHTPFSIEYRIVQPDGTERFVYEQGEWVEDDSGGKPHWRGIVQDITERKNIEEKLRETTENLKESQRIAKLGTWIWDIEEDREWWSDEIYRMLGWQEETPIQGGFEFLNYVHPDDRDRVLAAINRSINETVPYVVEYRVRHADGHEIIISEHAETEYDKAGKAVRMRGTTQDVTELKRMEKELARLNAELEQRVEERTAELRAAQAELVKSERLATLGQLTATVSHELRNPLGSMRTSMYVVQHKVESGDERLHAAIDRVNRNITRCDQIIDELLDYTRIRDLELRQMDMDEWLAAVMDEQPVPDSVTVARHFDAPGIRVPIDADRLRRAFINIYENACHAVIGSHNGDAPTQDARVTVATSVTKGRLEIAVSDNGQGIAPEHRDKIFEPLFSTKSFGVGLGLPTVKQIMEQHGGGVEIVENPDGGAIFALWLPLGGN